MQEAGIRGFFERNLLPRVCNRNLFFTMLCNLDGQVSPCGQSPVEPFWPLRVTRDND